MLNEDRPERIEHFCKNSNFLSRFTFWYTIPIFRKGRKRDFDEGDLTKPLPEHKSSLLGERIALLWSKEQKLANEHKDEPRLSKVLLKMFMKSVIVQGTILFLMEVPIRLCQPLFLGLLLKYFRKENVNITFKGGPKYLMRVLQYWDEQSQISSDEAILYVSGIVFCSLINVTVLHPCMMAIMHVGMQIRIACCSLIYRKTLRLDITALSGSTVGNVVNLMSNDVNRFDLALLYLHYLWIAPLQMFISLLLMYQEVNVAAVAGISVLLVIIPLQAWFGNRTSRFRLKTAFRTDERVRQMNEIIQGIQVIKMYTWEYAFAKKIHEMRKVEMKVLRDTSYIRGAILSFIMFVTRLALFVTVLTIIYRDKQILAEQVFMLSSFYQILRQTMTLFFPYAISQIAEVHVAVTRIKTFLLMPECKVGNPLILDPLWEPPNSNRKPENIRIVIKDISAKFGNEVCLKNVSATIENGDLVAIIGPVGAGKSCMLNLILGELQPFYGTIDVKGTVSYAAQEPWLFAGSVRQNIIFGQEFEKIRYYEVVKVCALARDFELLQFGDQTIVGEKGASLSGGQRARINLARAIYREADIYLLDDPLSAVDALVGKHLFDKCICEFLSKKIVILVTHQLQFLSEIKKVILMHNGIIEADGSFDFLKTAEVDFAEFLRNQLAVDSLQEVAEVSATKVDVLMKDLAKKSTLSLAVINVEGQKFKPQEVAEMTTLGAVECTIFKEYFLACGSCCLVITTIVLFLTTQCLCSGGDYFVQTWVNYEELEFSNSSTTDIPLSELGTDGCTIIYSCIIGLTIIVALTRSFVFFHMCMLSSVNLHNRMFESIIRGSMTFFNTNTSGRILNRFSKDLGAVDEFLPNALIDCTQIMLNLVGAAVVVVVINYYMIVPTILVCLIFYLLRACYLKTSRSVKRLEGISKSPVFTHLNATLQGLTTIRANGTELKLAQEFDELQDDHSSAWFMFIATSRAFGLWLDLVCTLYIAIVAYSFLVFVDVGSKVGLAITQTIGLTGLFQWGMKQSAEVENQMTSVERVLEFTRIEHEPDLQSAPGKKPPPEWPPEGGVNFENLVMRYKPNDPPILKSLNLSIIPKEKVGIVGRTGAGKSSLIAALFRLAYFDGAIIIDEVNTKEIGLHDLRRKISIIPQEPVLFSGSLRYNLDPFNGYDDDAIMRALVTVESKVALIGKDCLEYIVSEGGTNISVGERQMICLARAILRDNRILVMDEATANIDPQTDKFVQTTIRQLFAECTVLTIAHRLHTIMDSDRVLVMDAGQAVEFDHPHILLQNRLGILTGMVEKTGRAMSHNLKEVAKVNYERKNEK